jgi:hypothetical protein
MGLGACVPVAQRACLPICLHCDDFAGVCSNSAFGPDAGSALFVPGSGMVTVGNAAAFGISIVLREETRPSALRFNEVSK